MKKHAPAARHGAAGRCHRKRAPLTLLRKVKRMTELEKNLVRKACEKHATIYPCGPQKRFEQCFTREKEKVYFWFNTEDESTHIVMADAAS
jgi:hypothetical protein